MSKLTVAGLGGIASTLGSVTVPTGNTLQVNGNIYHTGTGALQLPTGTTAQRPANPDPGWMRWNTDDAALEWWTGSAWQQLASEDGSAGAPFTTMDNINSNDPGDGFFYIDFDGSGAEQTYLFKDANGKYWYAVASITDDTSHGRFTGGSDFWYGNWANTSTTGSASNFMGADFKSRHYSSATADDVLIMQGWSTSGTPYTTSTEVGYINGCFTTRGRNMRNMFTSHISLANHSNVGGTRIGGMVFLKGSAQNSDSRYRGNSAGELQPNNEWHLSPANCENYAFSMINALGCYSSGCNVEHHAWVGDENNNYSEQNFPEPNWSGDWGINNPGSENHMYWLFFYA